MAKIATPTASSLPHLRWFGGYHFTTCGKEWKIIYRCNENAVVLERAFGKGSIVLAGDTQFLMNQKLQGDSSGQVIHWLLDEHPHVVFNETHLGIKTNTGVMALVRRYRLHWFSLATLFLAILYVWRASMPLTPHQDPFTSGGFIAEGHAGSDGMDRLLEQHLSAKELLGTCLKEWEHTEARRRPPDDETKRRLDLIMADEEIPINHSLIVEAYKRICKYIKKT